MITARHRLSRRSVLRSGAALAGACAIGAAPRMPALAQGLTGSITVGFDASKEALGRVIVGAVAAVQEANPGAQVEVAAAPAGNFQTQLFLALGTGRAPDLFVTTGLGVGELGAGGYLQPLDPYLETWDDWAQYPEKVRESVTYQGTTWAIPTVLDVLFLYYRKDIFERAGLPRDWVPETLDDVLAAARQVKENVPDVMPYALYAGASAGNATAARGFLPLAFACGGTLTDEEGRWIIDSCPIRDALGFYETVYRTDQTVPEEVMVASNPSAMVREALGSGELAMVLEGSWVYHDWEAADPDVATNEIGYVPLPTVDGDTHFNVAGLGNSWYMNARTEHPDLAWAVIAAANTLQDIVLLNSVSSHMPPRQDAVDDPAFQETPFLSAMVAGFDDLTFVAPDPSFRQLVTVIQNATGLVATGEAAPDRAIERYAEEMTRILGEDRIVRQPCD
jgi:multiple sugar transport system substrate-binding protein